MPNFKIKKSMDFEALLPMCIRAGLEMKPDEKAPEGLMFCLELYEETVDKRVACAALVDTGELYLVRAVAVEEEYRGLGLGRRIIDELLTEAKKYGIKELMLTAKVPGFYKKFGFEVIAREEAPASFTDCLYCPQFHNGCDSEIMKLIMN